VQARFGSSARLGFALSRFDSRFCATRMRFCIRDCRAERSRGCKSSLFVRRQILVEGAMVKSVFDKELLVFGFQAFKKMLGRFVFRFKIAAV
jgi:hypothetical protein